MTTPSPSLESSSSRPKYSRIKKGTACNNCRALKIKCDGAKPQCTACTKFRRVQPCEYTEARPSVETLEAEIRTLKNRIEQLQNSPQPQSPASGGSSAQEHDVIYLHHPLEGATVSPQPSPGGSSQLWAPPSPSAVEYFTEQNRFFIELFIPHASNVGYFLDPKILQNPQTPNTPPQLSALLAVVCLWGLVFSKNTPNTHPAEGPLLKKALEAASTMLILHKSSYSLLEAIQTHILLSKYLFHVGQWDVASMHASSAASLVVSHRLHQKVDVDKEEIQVHAVWQALTTEASQAITQSAMGSELVPAVFDLSRACISICWPGDNIVEWARTQAPGTDTVQSFLRGVLRGGQSPAALFVKSIILMYHVTSMENIWTDPQHPLFSTFRSIAQLIDTVTFQVASSDILTLSITHYCALRLHKAFMHSEDEWSLHQCLASANAIVELGVQLPGADSGRPTWCNDLYGCIWSEALTMHYVRVQHLRSVLQNPWPGLDMIAVSTEERNHIGRFNQIFDIISNYAETSVVMGLALRRSQELASLL